MFFSVAWAQVQGEQTMTEKGILSLLWNSSPVVQLTLVILAVFSVVSWAIIFMKIKQFKMAQKDCQDFWGSFSQSPSLNDVLEKRAVKSGPLYEIFRTAMDMGSKFKQTAKGAFFKEHLMNRLAQAREEEIYKLEQYISFLGTTASTTPFIGLFGTVWGILTAFWAIGKAGSTSLATVGPYISEALVTTAIGLATAIPAVIAYNYFAGKIKILTKMMDLFIDDLLVKVEEEM